MFGPPECITNYRDSSCLHPVGQGSLTGCKMHSTGGEQESGKCEEYEATSGNDRPR